MQKLTQDKGLVSKCKYRSKLVFIELTLGIRFCESNSPCYKICLHCHSTNTAVMLLFPWGNIHRGTQSRTTFYDAGGGGGVLHEVEQLHLKIPCRNLSKSYFHFHVHPSWGRVVLSNFPYTAWGAYPSFVFSKVAIFFNYIMTIGSLSEGPAAIILTVVSDIAWTLYA